MSFAASLSVLVHGIYFQSPYPMQQTTVDDLASFHRVFGEQLEQPLYALVDPIAAVGLVAARGKAVL